MRIISKKRLQEFWEKWPQARASLEHWHKLTEDRTWRQFSEIRTTFNHADVATTDNGSPVVIFDIGGNKYRIIAAVHYNTGICYILRVLTHKEYDLAKWKKEL